VRRLADKELEKVASQKLIHLTTTGRKTRNPHTVELWFAFCNDKVYLSHEGSKTDWIKNIQNNDEVSFAIDGKHFGGRARILEKGTQEAWQPRWLSMKSTMAKQLMRSSRIGSHCRDSLRSNLRKELVSTEDHSSRWFRLRCTHLGTSTKDLTLTIAPLLVAICFPRPQV